MPPVPPLRALYGARLRGNVPDLPTTGLDELIARQREAFAARGEPAEWKIHTHDGPADLPARLRAAGFTPGWERAILVAPIEPDPASPPRLREVWGDPEEVEQLARIAMDAVDAVDAVPKRRAFAESQADDRNLSWRAYVLVLKDEAPSPTDPTFDFGVLV